MEGVILLFAIICIFYILYWSVKNDSVSSIDQQTGYIKMKQHKASSVKNRR